MKSVALVLQRFESSPAHHFFPTREKMVALKRTLNGTTSAVVSGVPTGIFAGVGSRLTNYLQERNPTLEVKLSGGTMVER